MEESKEMIDEADERSFIIIDELGRGTSTYDGASLAYSILKYIVNDIKCITFFSTHYHMLLEDFKLYKPVENYHMGYLKQGNEIRFLYKFIKGFIP